MTLKDKLKEGKLYLEATDKEEMTFKLTPEDIEEAKEMKSMTLIQARWYIRYEWELPEKGVF